MQVQTVSKEQVKLILSMNEGHFLDFKSKDIKPATITKSLCAFANADGGEIFLGVEDLKGKFSWSGFENVEAANGHIQAFENFFPMGDYFDYVFLENNNEKGLLLKAEIKKTPDLRRASNGSVYIRRGAQNLKQDNDEQIRRIELNKGISSFEDNTVKDELSNIDNSIILIEFLINIVPTAEPNPWLKKQRLVAGELPTVACEMLFHEEPQINVPKSGIKLYRYKSIEKEGTRDTLDFDPLTIEGSSITLITESVLKTKEIVDTIKIMGASGFERVDYPIEAIHEIITNAVIHRDYSINDEIHIRIFDNRIEIQSPGKLPGHVTATNILSERFARNPKIVRILNKFPNAPNKDVGEGLNTTFEVMRNLKLRDPIVEERESSVVVFLYHEKLASPQELIMEFLDINNEINNSKARVQTQSSC